MTTKKVTLDQLIHDLDVLGRDVPADIAQALLLFVVGTIGPETVRIVPHKGGTLRRSWDEGIPEIGPTEITIKFGYGTTYAIFVHEILDNQHTPPTQAKFLEQPTQEALPKLKPVMMDVLQTILEGGA